MYAVRTFGHFEGTGLRTSLKPAISASRFLNAWTMVSLSVLVDVEINPLTCRRRRLSKTHHPKRPSSEQPASGYNLTGLVR